MSADRPISRLNDASIPVTVDDPRSRKYMVRGGRAIDEGFRVAWYWSDDLARVVRVSGVRIDDALDRRLQGWEFHPVAHFGPDDAGALDVARSLLGMTIHRLASPQIDDDSPVDQVGFGAA